MQHVFVGFVNFSEVFDKVNYWKLLSKLLDNELIAILFAC
jgi:hypothetical protein